MVRIPYIKIPSVRVGTILPTSNIGTGGATPAPPTPITYLTQWKIVGNSEVHGNEIWSCGEYSEVDRKYHILVQPLGGSIADIALDEPLRKVNNVADSIEFPSDTEGKALVTRYFAFIPDLGVYNYVAGDTRYTDIKCMRLNNKFVEAKASSTNGLCSIYNIAYTYSAQTGWAMSANMYISFYDADYNTAGSTAAFKTHMTGASFIYELATPTTELVDAPQIAEAESYTCVISQGANAVSWSDFIYDSDYLLTDSENNILVDSENYQLTVQS